MSRRARVYFVNLTGYILDDQSCVKVEDTVELLRELGSQEATETLTGKVPPAYRWERIQVRITRNGVTQLS